MRTTDVLTVIKSKKAMATLLIASVLLAIIPNALSSLISSVAIVNTGSVFQQGTLKSIVADSGHAPDIQSAVNYVATNWGTGTVYIPDGTFNFVNTGEAWVTVQVPAGVNIMAQTSPDMDPAWNNRFPLTCHTILKLPYDVQSGPVSSSSSYKDWFHINGNGDLSKPSRFSGIELQGYRSVNSQSVQILLGILIFQVMDFRVDHNIFENIARGVSYANGGPSETDPSTTAKSRGVFDHNKLVNTIGYANPGGYDLLTVGYGIQPIMFNSRYWDSNIQNILGKYTDYSIYIEDNYFSKWRHSISAGSGVHAVFRYNVIDYSYGNGDVDVHGQGLTYEGGRCLEVYGNQIINAVLDGGYDWNGVHHSTSEVGSGNQRAVNFRGGAGVCFNNTVDASTYDFLAMLENEQPGINGGTIHDLYFWNNQGQTALDVISGGPVLNTDYFLHAPTTFVYTPYVYPHPLDN